ncbi:DUF4397 domain-containing protein [Parapedobacter sp. DT-150]|uniref:DUF4397 domain-containing protein n=1 Tax=Parapedobacter sp. DT-150 TaxID=3396162 RepID=UPI003F1CA940
MKSRSIFMLVALAMGMATLSSCLKDNENSGYQVSAVRALNAVPGSSSLDIGLDENKLNFDNTTGQDEDFAYEDTLVYKNAWPGNRLVRVFDPEDYPNAQPLAQGTVTFTPGKFYSLYVVGYEDMEIIATEDDLSEPGEGKAKIRFMNLSPDAPALDFGIEGADTLIASDKAFKEAEDFSSIDADETYTFNIIDHDSGEVVHTFEFAVGNDMIYTIWAKGLLDHTGDAALDFGHGIITH